MHGIPIWVVPGSGVGVGDATSTDMEAGAVGGEDGDVRDVIYELLRPAEWSAEATEPPGGCRACGQHFCGAKGCLLDVALRNMGQWGGAQFLIVTQQQIAPPPPGKLLCWSSTAVAGLSRMVVHA